MPRRDLMHNIDVGGLSVPAVRTADAVGATLDLLGYDGAMFIFLTGAIVGAGLFTWKLQECDDNATWTDVAAGDMQPDAVMAALTSLQLTASMIGRVGYIGKQRYARGYGVYVSGTSLALAIAGVRGFANQRPLA